MPVGQITTFPVDKSLCSALVAENTNYTARDVIDDGAGKTTLMLEAD